MITAYFDGGARGNPGPAGFGVYIVGDDGKVLAEIGEGIGVATNNVAEYRGLLAALQWAVDHGVKTLAVKGDSQLLIQQMLGNYRVKNEGLLPLYRRARHLVVQIGDVTFEHVRREQNKDADRLSNLGMDQNTPAG
jgi:ribonuclease HI